MEGRQKLNGLRGKNRGVIALEVCFTLPVVVYLIFFSIELIKINITQDALQSICEEATYLTIAHDYSSGPNLIAKIDAIVEKYRPSFIPEKISGHRVIRYDYYTFDTLSNMVTEIPYGGYCIYYPPYEKTISASQAHIPTRSQYWEQTQYIPSFNMQYIPEANQNDMWNWMGPANGQGLPNNRVFIITISCAYPFSNPMVRWLFNGGINTKFCTQIRTQSSKEHTQGNLYLLWARGAGIVNPKQ